MHGFGSGNYLSPFLCDFRVYQIAVASESFILSRYPVIPKKGTTMSYIQTQVPK
jgi:hypothetical protein